MTIASGTPGTGQCAHDGQAVVSEVLSSPETTRSSPDWSPSERPLVQGYRCLVPIGFGGQGTVYRATQDGTGRSVAIKLLAGGSAAGDEQRFRFRTEMEVSARLDHDNIARVLDSGMDGEHPYIVMELVDGLALRGHVADRSPSRRAKLALFLQVCAGVDHAHQRGVIHRDIKPENVLVTRAAKVKVLDFGIAKASGQEGITALGDCVGTLRHAAPEQVLRRVVDVRTDVHALGLILLELLTGRRPHADI